MPDPRADRCHRDNRATVAGLTSVVVNRAAMVHPHVTRRLSRLFPAAWEASNAVRGVGLNPAGLAPRGPPSRPNSPPLFGLPDRPARSLYLHHRAGALTKRVIAPSR
ncbi:hypothetical protein JCM13210_13410 [Thermaerobacter litoralis]